MNIHILISLVIVAVTAAFAVLQESRRSDLDKEHVTLQEEAVTLGLPVDGGPIAKSDVSGPGAAGSNSYRGSRSPRPRGDTSSTAAETARQFAGELFAFAAKVKEWEERGEEPSREDKLELMSFVNRFMSLDADVIPPLIDEVRAYTGIEENTKREILGMAVMMLAQTAPERALDIYLNSEDLFGDEAAPRHMVRQALTGWAARDPKAVLSWLDLHGPSLEGDAAEEARRFAIASSFKHDPDYALDLALGLKQDELQGLTRQISTLMQTPENQLGLLRGLENRLGELPSDPTAIDEEFLASATPEQLVRGSLLLGLGETLSTHSFEAASEFLDSAELGATEKFVVARGLAEKPDDLPDPGAWLPWIHSNSPEGERDHVVSSVVKSWTQSDFRSAAAWIGDQPSGPLRERATYSFATTVAPHEPASAAEWALTLPASEQRTELLREIDSHWSGKDQEAADAFAAQQGLR